MPSCMLERVAGMTVPPLPRRTRNNVNAAYTMTEAPIAPVASLICQQRLSVVRLKVPVRPFSYRAVKCLSVELSLRLSVCD